jgi:hypothetical protein
MGKTRRGLGEREKCCAALAMEDHEGGSALAKSEWGGVSNVTYPELGCSNRVVDEVDGELAELWTWIGF